MRRLILAALAALTLSTGAFARGYDNSANKPDAPSKAAMEQDRAVIDINSASKDELKSLPGVGEAYAQRIIDNRPYHGKNDLLRRGVVPKSTYAQIKDRVVARRDQTKPVKTDTTK